jgi:hypothetical protein
MTDFEVDRSRVIAQDFAGFGAQYNQNVYAAISRNAGVTDENVLVMERQVAQLKPHFVRVFFNGDALRDADLMQSFRRTLKLAQKTSSTINVTFQGIGPHAHADAMPAFARVLHDALVNDHVDKLKWVTIRNEPNVPAIPKPMYKDLYVQLDRELQSLGVRPRIRFMGGDLRIEHQQEWFTFLADEMRELLDAHSIHVYWSYLEPDDSIHGIEARLAGVRRICNALSAAGRKPLYVTEYGARGIPAPGKAKANPGLHRDHKPLSETNVNAFQHAWFSLRAAMLGYKGTVKWDAYFGRYDSEAQEFALIGHPDEGWPLQPVYRLLRLFTTAVTPGAKVVAVDGADQTRVVVGFDGPGDRLTVIGLDTAGGNLNSKTTTVRPYRLHNLPANTPFQLRFWNFAGDSRNTAPAQIVSDAFGTLGLDAPLHTVFALSRLDTS